MDILVEASLKAIDDAGVSERDFDSVHVGNMLAGELSHQTAIAGALVDGCRAYREWTRIRRIGHEEWRFSSNFRGQRTCACCWRRKNDRS